MVGPPTVFVSSFAGFTLPGNSGERSKFRAVGVAVAPDGSLYVADSQQGRIWRISYGE